MTTEDHPDSQLLERFMRGEVDARERRWVVRHLLAGCARCTAVTRRLWSFGAEGRGTRKEDEARQGCLGLVDSGW
jgi:hypothetical protein